MHQAHTSWLLSKVHLHAVISGNRTGGNQNNGSPPAIQELACMHAVRVMFYNFVNSSNIVMTL